VLLVVALGLFVPLLLFSRAMQGSWLAPAPLFAAYWSIATFAPLLLLDGARVSYRALIYVAAAAWIFALGGMLATAGAGAQQIRPMRQRDGRPLTAVVWIGTVAGLAASVFAVRVNGFSIGQALSLQGLLSVGSTASVNRYSGMVGEGVVTATLLGLAYGAALVAPFRLLLPGRMPRLWSLRPLLGVTVYSTLTTERLVLLLGVALTTTGLVAALLVRDGRLPAVSARRVIAGLLAIIVLAATFVAIAFVRVGDYSPDIQQRIERKLEVYAFGYLPAFSAWVQDRNRAPETPLGYGTSSVAGVSYLTGQDRDATRAYNERVTITEGGLTTNVYTGFRNLILDFGTAGGALVVALWGFITGRAYLAARVQRSVVSAAVMASSYSLVLLSNTMLVTTFSNVAAALAFGVIFLAWTFPRPVNIRAPKPLNRPVRPIGEPRAPGFDINSRLN